MYFLFKEWKSRTGIEIWPKNPAWCRGRILFLCKNAVSSAAAAEQVISEQHTGADDKKADEITWNDPHQKHADSDAEKGIAD